MNGMFRLLHFRLAMRSCRWRLPSTNSGRCLPCSTKLIPRPSRITKKILSGRLARRLADDAKQASRKAHASARRSGRSAYRMKSLACLSSTLVRSKIIGMCGERPGRRLLGLDLCEKIIMSRSNVGRGRQPIRMFVSEAPHPQRVRSAS